MADDKKGGKGDKKKESTGALPDQAELILGLLFILLVGSVIASRFNSFLNSRQGVAGLSGSFQEKFFSILPSVQFVSITVSVILLIPVIILTRKIIRIRREERAELYPAGAAPLAPGVPVEIVNKKWERVLAHANSTNPSDWRLAIIEADIMLDELLDVQGYKGDSIGDKLKTIEKSDFLTLDAAWDAHKIRNAIAHEGSSFNLNERETRRVIDLYKQVFEEFKYI